jgi:hypothetical protein
MKRVFSLSAVILGSALIGFGASAFAGQQDSNAVKEAVAADRASFPPLPRQSLGLCALW